MPVIDLLWSATKYEAIWCWQHKEMLIGGGLGIWKLIKSGKAFFAGQFTAQINTSIQEGLKPIEAVITSHAQEDKARDEKNAEKFQETDERLLDIRNHINDRMDAFVIALDKISDRLRSGAPHYGD